MGCNCLLLYNAMVWDTDLWRRYDVVLNIVWYCQLALSSSFARSYQVLQLKGVTDSLTQWPWPAISRAAFANILNDIANIAEILALVQISSFFFFFFNTSEQNWGWIDMRAMNKIFCISSYQMKYFKAGW